MVSYLRLIIISGIGLIALYWLAVIVARSTIGVEMPDPTDLLPQSWRGHIPRRL
jgi:hypothetical protein